MNQRPLVSVCIPAYNGSQFIGECLGSISDQSFADFEIVIHDDASTDATVQVIKAIETQEPRIRLFLNSRRVGANLNATRCLASAHGKFLTFVGQDDMMLPSNLDMKVTRLEADPSVGMVHSAAIDIDADGSPFSGYWTSAAATHYQGVLPPPKGFWRLLRQENTVCSSTVVMRASCLEELGPPEPQLTLAADWEMWLRFGMTSSVAYIGEPLVQYRWHGNQLTEEYRGRPDELIQRWRTNKIALDRYVKLIGSAADAREAIDVAFCKEALHLAHRSSSSGDTLAAIRFLTVASREAAALRGAPPSDEVARAMLHHVRNARAGGQIWVAGLFLLWALRWQPSLLEDGRVQALAGEILPGGARIVAGARGILRTRLRK